MTRPLIVLILIASVRASSADCLEVSEQPFEVLGEELGVLEIEWQAQIENKCDANFDADMTVQFLDASGEPVYEVLDWATISIRETREISKRVYIPDRYADSITTINIQVTERERPF